MHTERFVPLTIETAPEGARGILAASQKQFGFLPSPVAKAGHSATLLKHLLAGFAAFDRSSLSLLEREVVALTVAFENECHYCMAMHSAMLSGNPEAAPFVQALRHGQSLADVRLEALRQFARSVLLDQGRVSENRWKALEAAGYSEEQAL